MPQIKEFLSKTNLMSYLESFFSSHFFVHVFCAVFFFVLFAVCDMLRVSLVDVCGLSSSSLSMFCFCWGVVLLFFLLTFFTMCCLCCNVVCYICCLSIYN